MVPDLVDLFGVEIEGSFFSGRELLSCWVFSPKKMIDLSTTPWHNLCRLERWAVLSPLWKIFISWLNWSALRKSNMAIEIPTFISFFPWKASVCRGFPINVVKTIINHPANHWCYRWYVCMSTSTSHRWFMALFEPTMSFSHLLMNRGVCLPL